MQKILDGIYKVDRDPGSPGFGYSYLLKRCMGNVLLCRLGKGITIDDAYPDIKDLGGIKTIFVTDYHFGADVCEEIAETFDSTIVCSVIEKPKLKKRGLLQVTALPYECQNMGKDMQVIPVPGHSSGGFALIWVKGKTRYLFTGDFLYNAGTQWTAGAKSRRKIQASLELLKDLSYDYLVGCGDDECGCPYLKLKTKQEKVAFVDSVIARLK